MTTKYTYKQHNRTLVHNVHSAVSKMFRIYSILCNKNLFLICTDQEQFHTNVQMCTTFLKRTYAYIHRHNAYALNIIFKYHTYNIVILHMYINLAFK